MRWQHQGSNLQAYARTFDRSARLVPLSHWFFRALTTVAFWVDPRRFAVTIGPLVGIPDDASCEAVRNLIPHEVAGHVRQYRACGLWIHPWAGLLGMCLVYGLLLFPVGLAWPRYRLELHAETQKWREQLRMGDVSAVELLSRARAFGATVAGPAYLWAWPRPWVVRGFERRAAKVLRDHYAPPRL